jgi:CHASE2 domain-containing sensor protein
MNNIIKYRIIAVFKNKHKVFKENYLILMMVILLTVFAFLQLNDPDALLWTAIYLFAACLCLLAMYQKLWRWLTVVSSLLFMAGAIRQWPEVYKGITGTMNNNPEIELARESLGLVICAVFVMLSFFLQKKK